MGRFYGKVLFAVSVEKPPLSGIYKPDVVERDLYGESLRSSKTQGEGDKVNSDITINATIRVIADAYAYENYTSIVAVFYEGAFWKVAEVTPERPRLALRLGGLYNGRTPSPSG